MKKLLPIVAVFTLLFSGFCFANIVGVAPKAGPVSGSNDPAVYFKNLSAYRIYTTVYFNDYYSPGVFWLYPNMPLQQPLGLATYITILAQCENGEILPADPAHPSPYYFAGDYYTVYPNACTSAAKK